MTLWDYGVTNGSRSSFTKEGHRKEIIPVTKSVGLWRSVFCVTVVAVLQGMVPAHAQNPFTIVHRGVEFAERNKPLAISVTIDPDDQLEYASIFYRRPGNRSYSQLYLQKIKGGNYRAEIDAKSVTAGGIEYYISAVNRKAEEFVLFGSPEKPQYVSTKRVALIMTEKIERYDRVVEGIRTHLKADIEPYDMNKDDNQGKTILDRLLKSGDKPDLIVAIGQGASRLCRDNVKDVPVVFSMVTNPQREDLKTKNMTGISLDVPVKSQLVTFKSVVPKIQKVGVLYDPKNTGDLIEQAKFIAPSQGFEILPVRVDDPNELGNALRKFEGGIDALWLVPDKTVVRGDTLKLILKFTLDRKIPFFVFEKSFVTAGALVGLSPDLTDIGRKVGEMSNRILGGADPGLITIAAPEKLMVTLNNETAKAIGVDKTIALNVMQYAAENSFPIEITGSR